MSNCRLLFLALTQWPILTFQAVIINLSLHKFRSLFAGFPLLSSLFHATAPLFCASSGPTYCWFMLNSWSHPPSSFCLLRLVLHNRSRFSDCKPDVISVISDCKKDGPQTCRNLFRGPDCKHFRTLFKQFNWLSINLPVKNCFETCWTFRLYFWTKVSAATLQENSKHFL